MFVAYDAEKKVARQPERFGRGAIEGVAAPESANNATSSAGFIPLMALGIPASPPLALLLGGLTVYGLSPGPLLFQKNPDFVWTVIASLYVGNVILLILNLPLIGLWVRITRIPYGILGPLILLLCFLGTYSVRNSMFDVAREPRARRRRLRPAQVPLAAGADGAVLHPGAALGEEPDPGALHERRKPADLRPARPQPGAAHRGGGCS